MLLLLLATARAFAQEPLTVEKIMRDPKWIGSSPAGVNWSYDSKSVYFSWNPDKNVSDSLYSFAVNGTTPVKLAYNDAGLMSAINNGRYNNTYTQIVYAYRGDIFLLDLKTNKTTRVTQTQDFENDPNFIVKNEWIVYQRNQNLFVWNTKTGTTQQLTNLVRSGETVPAVPAAFAGRGGGGGRGGAGGGNAGAAANANQQDQWLQRQSLSTSDILKERKSKRDQRTAFLATVRDRDTLKTINIGDRTLQGLQISPDGRFVTYRLFQPATGAKNTIVPDYVTESGYTTDIPGRTKVGSAQGRYEFCVYDRQRDTVMTIATDSVPGITDAPDYLKDYPAGYGNRRAVTRGVMVFGPYWNETGTAALVELFAQDHKDRWVMLLDAVSGKLRPIDRQRDEAWVAGPGIGGFGNGSIGWINNETCWFQGETTGYSHVYTYNTGTRTKTALTKGDYEVQNAILSRNKQFFYLLTNEEHPGKQNWYRIKTDGSGKEKITGMTGGYDVSLSPDEKYIAYRYSYINKPWELYIQENSPGKKPVQVTNIAVSDAFKAYPWRETKIFTITARDGKPIYARLYEPAAGKKNNAAVIFVHGAGYLQNVHYWWSSYFREYMFNNLLADKGYTVLDIDYRGSAGYGRDWRTGIYRFMGGKDLDDEVDAAKWLVKEAGIDAGRIGMYGGSYGGFMTLMALFTQPDVIKAGAALRPVTDWAHYNHGYTSNILNEPFNDSLAYARSSPINVAAGLKNHLLICHGMVDVNVNFQDAVRLNQRLIELGKDNWEMAVYPVEDHGFVEASSWTDEYKRILKLFDTYLR
jgi:dipeptidyl aminopeptidase/acylaminoacyl peptidase